MRINIDINIVLLNNKIYGLTKGQYSPTSEVGKRTKSSPQGSLDAPMNPIAMAIASGSTFIARSLDVDVKLLTSLLDRGARHKGTSFVEVYQDCNVFNHEAWFYASQKDSRSENTIVLEHGKPLLFGSNNEKAICQHGNSVIVGSPDSETVLIHDETNIEQAFLLSQLFHPEFPEPLGVFYVNDAPPTYNDMLHEQVDVEKTKHGEIDLQTLVSGTNTWTITK